MGGSAKRTRREVLLSGVTLATVATLTAVPVRAFVPALIGRALMGLVGGTVRSAGALGTRTAVSAMTQQRVAQAGATLAGRRAVVRTSDILFGTFSRGAAHGAGTEVGKFAARKLLEALSEGFSVIPGRGRPTVRYPEEDVIFGCFPNHGSLSDVIILGCPDLLVLSGLLSVLKTDFQALYGYNDLPYNLTLNYYPIEMDREPHFDDDFVSRVPTVFVTAGCVIAIRSFRGPDRRRLCECTVRDRYTRRERYQGNIPLHPQFL